VILIQKKHGFTVLEAVAAIAIISFVLVSTISLLINVQNQNKALNKQINATSYATMIRDDIQSDVSISDITAWYSVPLTHDNHPVIIAYAFDEMNNPYYLETVITFNLDTNSPTWITVVRFTVVITYYQTRTLTIEGVLYE